MVIPDPNPLYTYSRATQLEGTFPSDDGAWLTSAMRVGKHLGWLDEADAPKWDGTWPPEFPERLDLIAKPNRQQWYQRIRNAEEVRYSISRGVPVMAVFEITAQWQVGDGRIDVPAEGDEVIGMHAICMDGYNENGIQFANSWGGEWGSNGCGEMSYDFFDSCLVEAYTQPPNDPLLAPTGIAEEAILWGRHDPLAGLHPGAKHVHGMEVWDFAADVLKGWALVVERGIYLDVEELFVWPDYRRTGVGDQLMSELRRLSRASRMPLRLWVPHCDGYAENEMALDAVARRLGVCIRPSPERWASYLGEPAGIEAAPARVPPSRLSESRVRSCLPRWRRGA
jgi:GNAT superfamily N-acetyltransferase